VFLKLYSRRFFSSVLLLVLSFTVVVELTLSRIHLLSVVDESAVTGTRRFIRHDHTEAVRIVHSVVVKEFSSRFTETG
jgi:hypothetical protein